MTSLRLARTFAGLARAAGVSSLMACGLLYGFDRYDTDVVPGHDAGPAAESGGAPDFTLLAMDAFRVEPGTTALLVVEVERRGASSGRIAVDMAEPLPIGLERASSATLEADISTATLVLAARPDAPVTSQTLHLRATSASGAHTKDVALTFRGGACQADKGFSPNGTGTTSFASHGLSAATNAVVSPDGAGITLMPGSVADGIFRLDAKGGRVWSVGAEYQAIGFTVDPTGGVIFASPLAVTRRNANGGVDLAYGAAGNGVVQPPCAPVTITQQSFETSIVCAAAKGQRPTLLRYDAAGLPLSSESVDFGVGHEVIINASTGRGAVGGVVACGHSVEGALGPLPSAAFVRWLASGKTDDTFGVGGRVVLGTGTDAFACAADDVGVVGLANSDGQLLLVGLDATGGLQTTFGRAGIEPLADPSGAPADSARMVLDTGAILAVVTVGTASFVVRYRRDGQLDTTFGHGGSCALGPLSLATVASIAMAPDGKLLVLSTVAAQTLLARIWL